MCRQLGFLDAVSAPRSSHYGQGTGPIWLDDVNCLGSEPDLFTCGHNGIGNHDCRHFEDASAECSGNPQNCKDILYSKCTYKCYCVHYSSIL